MGRIDRRVYSFSLPQKGSIPDLMDGFFQLLFRLEEEKTEQLLQSLTEEEIDYLTGEISSYRAKKQFIQWLDYKIQSCLP